MTEQIVKCVCGRLYNVYAFMVGDQSFCPKCRASRKKTAEDVKPWRPEMVIAP